MSEAANERYGGVDDLGPAALLAALTDNEVVRRQADRKQLELAYQWCILHPATADTGTAQWVTRTCRAPWRRTSRRVGRGRRRRRRSRPTRSRPPSGCPR